MTDTIKFLKTRNVKSPSRANKYDAGIDFYVPEFTEDFIIAMEQKNPDVFYMPTDEGDYFLLQPQQRILIPSGIHCQMSSPHRALIAANKSGIATKTGLIFGAQVVDYEYQGEIHISLINTSAEDVFIRPGMKAIQFLEMPIYNSEIEITENISTEDFYKGETTRGAGGFGSTDHK
jgi:deoxyuridine 5'-triphosphate nucleotidohydrolase